MTPQPPMLWQTQIMVKVGKVGSRRSDLACSKFQVLALELGCVAGRSARMAALSESLSHFDVSG